MRRRRAKRRRDVADRAAAGVSRLRRRPPAPLNSPPTSPPISPKSRLRRVDPCVLPDSACFISMSMMDFNYPEHRVKRFARDDHVPPKSRAIVSPPASNCPTPARSLAVSQAALEGDHAIDLLLRRARGLKPHDLKLRIRFSVGLNLSRAWRGGPSRPGGWPIAGGSL